MQTDLAEIDSMTRTMLDYEYDAPTIPLKTKFIAGFELPDDEAQTRECEHRRSRIDAIRKHRTDIIKDLAKCEITPLAVIPRLAWDRICDNSGLYRFDPDKNGCVAPNVSDAKYISFVAGFLGGLLWLMPPATIFYVMISMRWPGTPNISNCLMILTMIGMIIGGFFMFIQLDARPFVDVHVALARLFMQLTYDRANHQWQMKRLFPDMKGLSITDQTTPRTRLLLPVAPESVAERIKRATKGGFSMRVAVVTEGFQLGNKPSDLFVGQIRKNAIDRIAKTKAGLREFALADPIIYTVRADLVAIIDQFGEFPIEREAVEKALDAESLAIL